MKSTLVILLPVVLAIFLAGGLSIRAPKSGTWSASATTLNSNPNSNPVTNALQLTNLVPGTAVVNPPGGNNPPPDNGNNPPPGNGNNPPPGGNNNPPPGGNNNPPPPGGNTPPSGNNYPPCTIVNPNTCIPQGNCPAGQNQRSCTATSIPSGGNCQPQYNIPEACGHTTTPSTCQDQTEQCGVNHIPGCNCAVDSIVTCHQGACVKVVRNNGSSIPCDSHYNSWCSQCARFGPQEGDFCFAKPVIYLYPTKITNVNVSIKTMGRVVVSDPIYPEGGWQDVVAYPGGALFYQGLSYKELFYETSVSDFKKPKDGVVIKTEELASKLDYYITRLGLTEPAERTEFLDWWLPKLKALNSPYILFSVLDPQEKERTDQVNINPKPDTMIQFIAYFKPLGGPITVPALILPKSAPKRVGFTAVEWGGVIDQ